MQQWLCILLIIVVSFIAGAVFYFLISRRKFKYLIKKASHDEMSGLLNFQAFKKLADIKFDEAKKYNKSLAILLIDIDNLKSINDSFEYKYGDIAIKKMAGFLKSNFRSNDLLARFKLGDEFIVLLEDIDNENLQNLISRILLNADLKIEEINEKVGFSIGYTLNKSEDKSIYDLISRAETKLKKIKYAKHNR